MFDGNPVAPDKAQPVSEDVRELNNSVVRDIYVTTYFNVLGHLLYTGHIKPNEAVPEALKMARLAAKDARSAVNSL